MNRELQNLVRRVTFWPWRPTYRKPRDQSVSTMDKFSGARGTIPDGVHHIEYRSTRTFVENTLPKFSRAWYLVGQWPHQCHVVRHVNNRQIISLNNSRLLIWFLAFPGYWGTRLSVPQTPEPSTHMAHWNITIAMIFQSSDIRYAGVLI